MRDLPLGIRPRLINKTPQEAVAIPAAASCRYINSRPVRTPGWWGVVDPWVTLRSPTATTSLSLSSRPPRTPVCPNAIRRRLGNRDIHAAANVRIGREPGGECRRDLARGKRSATPGKSHLQENASCLSRCAFANVLHLQNKHYADCLLFGE